jgi:hypothetical protein
LAGVAATYLPAAFLICATGNPKYAAVLESTYPMYP